MMFSKNVKTTLLRGPKKLSKSFMFEAATYWAEEGQRVVYITPVPLDKRPDACHDRKNPTVAALKLMRFVYLSDYEALVEQLFKLHTYAAVPSVLLIDDLHDYLRNETSDNMDDSTRIARIYASILHSIKSCSRILKKNVHVCAWDSSTFTNNSIQTMYFRNIWNLTEKEDGKVISVDRFSITLGRSFEQSYIYHKFQDGTRVLQQILCDLVEI
ncbi:uncharacterized protein LOC105196104 [Solenopsis invicta]|uniref:uncharacterized protein LOC105196104 n=1 Tax=Solenopsis invicta TaxID=13686 RepID=UPI000595EF9C|nr:uncharacterized protein LOC105196104 [Solenopsis invicta]XP_011160157.1 uncharacterized protein LOC105196104 [Solenopsis invicta]